MSVTIRKESYPCPGCKMELAIFKADGKAYKEDIGYCFNVECKLYSAEQSTPTPRKGEGYA